MKAHITNSIGWRLFISISIVAALLLGGCSGDGSDGNDGAPGPVGPQGDQGDQGIAPAGDIPSELFSTIDNVEVSTDGTVTLAFSLTDSLGRGFNGLPSNRVRFSLVKLQAQDTSGQGNSSEWQSYIENSVGQATYENSGTFTDNNNGSYTYIYDTNVTNAAVAYEANLTHRVAFQLSGGGFPIVNASYDLQPSTGATVGLETRSIVKEETCNQCHGVLALHGSGRIDTDYCVTCHNPGSVDPDTGNTVDFKVMVHKIHRGANLPSVKAGGKYNIIGYRGSDHDYSEVEFPQDIRNCETCHVTSESTPDAGNWATRPNIEACGACHDNIDFSKDFVLGDESTHGGGAQSDNSQCSACHSPNTSLGIATVHNLAGKQAAQDEFQLQIDGVSVAANLDNSQLKDLTINVTFLTGDGSPISGAAGSHDFIFDRDPKLLYNWINPDTGYQTNYSQNFFGLDTSSTAIHMASAIDTGNNNLGQHSYVVQGLDLEEDDSILVTHDILLCVDRAGGTLLDCNNANAEPQAAKAVSRYFDSNGATLSEAPVTFGANREKCNSCHKDLQAHPTPHNHGATEFDQCRSCHNTNRIAWEFDEATDFKSIVHRFHDSNFHGTAVEFPDVTDNCLQCHESNQYNLPLQANVWPEVGTNGATSPTAVVCSSCHLDKPIAQIDLNNLGSLSTSDQALIDHMVNNGAIFGGSVEQANKVESCAVCHAIGKEAGVDAVHNIR